MSSGQSGSSGLKISEFLVFPGRRERCRLTRERISDFAWPEAGDSAGKIAEKRRGELAAGVGPGIWAMEVACWERGLVGSLLEGS